MPEINERIRRLLDEKVPPAADSRTHAAAVIAALRGALLRLAASAEHLAGAWRSRLAATLESKTNPSSPLRQELADHLRDAYDYQLELGRTPEEAWAHVIGHFGDYEAILGELETLHHVPFWEWLSRLLAFPFVLVLFFTYGNLYAGLRYSSLVSPIIILLTILAAPLAACNPRDWGWPAWTRWLTRGAALGAMFYLHRREGISWPEILLVSLGIVFVAVYGRPFASPRFITRLRAYIVAALLGGVALGMTYILANVTDPQTVGYGIAFVFIHIVYAVLFGQPNWKILALFSALCPAILLKVQLMWSHDPFRVVEPLWTARFFAPPLTCTAIALVAGWAMYGRRTYAWWLPAAGVLAMVGVMIGGLSNLVSASLMMNIMIGSLLPLLLWLAPLVGLIRVRLRK